MKSPNFSPPDFRPPKIPEWASYIPQRHPKFKAHNNRGQAVNAINYDSREGWLYRLYQGKWIPWAYKPEWTKSTGVKKYQHKLILPLKRECTNENCRNEVIDPDDYICDQCRKLQLS
jgi:hypothetical protein